MTLLIAGLMLFLGSHSLKIVASPLRDHLAERFGKGWRGLFSLVSGVGFVLIIIGYGQARGGAPLWAAPASALHLTLASVAATFVLITAAYWPGNHIKAWVKDPMVLGVAFWGFGHLISKSTPAAVLLFGAFAGWAVIDYVSFRFRPPPEMAPTPRWSATIGTLIVGLVLAGLFAHFGHKLLIGVDPFAGVR